MSETLSISPALLSLISSVISMVVGVVSLGVAVFTYVAMSVGLLRMSKSCGLKHGWISFIPYAQSFRFGQIADYQCEVNEGKSTTYRHKLLIFHILQSVFSAVYEGTLVAILMDSLIEKAQNGTLDALMKDSSFINNEMAAAEAEAWFPYLLFLGFAIVNLVFCCMAIQQLAKLFIPKMAGAVVALYLFVPLARPILFLVMGARKPQIEDRSAFDSGDSDNFYTL